MKAKAFSKMAAQGDVAFRRIDRIPASAKPIAAKPGAPLVVTHSESGHDHVLVHNGALMFECDPPNPLLCYLRVESLDGATLEHRRPFDTHAPLFFAPGDYEIRRQREYVPDGFRRVED